MKLNRRAVLAGGGALAATAAAPAIGQSKWPSKEITLINPNAPGAATDLTARIIAEALSKNLSATVIVKNVVGGAGALGPTTLAQSAPDGHTMGLVAISSQITVPAAMAVQYKPWESFDFLGQVATLRYGIGVGVDSPIKTIEELVEAGKKKLLTYASNNVTNVVAMFQLAKATGARFRWVVFGGGVESVTQAIGGHVDAVIQTVTEMKPQIDAGKLRFLAAAAVERWPDYPEVKTLREHGWNAVSHGPFGYAYPAGVDPAIKNRMEKALGEVMADKTVQSKIAELGVVPVYRSGKEYYDFLKGIETDLLPILVETGLKKS